MSKLTKVSKMSFKPVRSRHTLDANGMNLGRLASRAAGLLIGKHKVNYTPHLDLGDWVTVVNAQQIGLSGNKAIGKIYFKYSGYPGGMRQTKAGEMRAKKPGELIRLAVKRMLPKNSLGAAMIRRLIIKK